MNMTAVMEGILEIPLYHGTSKYFWPQIEQYGLGGRNVLEEVKARDALEFLFSSVDHDKAAEVCPNWLAIKNTIGQRTTNGGFNFQHGHAYGIAF